jgi:endonuclease/exonuclease/phosphatase (EEP) superfamily protein YafD
MTDQTIHLPKPTPHPEPAASPGGLRGLLTRLLLAAADLYAGGVIAYLLLRVTVGDRFWLVSLAGTFLQWILLPGFVFLAILVAMKRWPRVAMALVPVVAFLGLYGGLLMPHPRPQTACAAEDGCQHLRVMTFNIASGAAPGESVLGAIQAADPDIVALEELVQSQIDVLDPALADEYPYRVHFPAVINGKGLWSRYPILDAEMRVFGSDNTQLVTTVDIDGTLVTVVAAHPPRPRLTLRGGYVFDSGVDEDYRQLAAIGAAGGPAILMGDFNNTDQSNNYRVMRQAGLTDVFRAAGSGLGDTFPARLWPLPPVRIDFIWVTDHFEPLHAAVGPDGGSDHYPVVADLVWQPGR